jgi:hypothetical protein
LRGWKVFRSANSVAIGAKAGRQADIVGTNADVPEL